MRTALVFITIFVSALFFGALFAYPAYMGINTFHEMSFHKVISRTTVLSGLFFSLAYVRIYGLFNLQALGLVAGTHSKRKLFILGFASGVVILTMLDSVLLSLGIYVIDPDVAMTVSYLTTILLKSIITGILVATIEETIFRGALFAGLRNQANAAIAIFVTSFMYAAVHFIKYRALPDGTVIGWFTGTEIFPAALFRFSNPITIDSFITLFILGCLFAAVRVRSRSLLACIGLHAGIVASLKFFNYLTNYTAGSPFDYLVNKIDHQFGYLASTILLLALFVFYLYSRTDETDRGKA